MKKTEISTYEFDPDKKDAIHRVATEKLLKEIKALLSKKKKIKVSLTEVP